MDHADPWNSQVTAMLRSFQSLLGLLLATFWFSECRATDVRPEEISHRIDQHLGLDKTEAVRYASDAEFLRRVTLDLTGRIPTISEVHEYLGEQGESRRSTTIHRLMQAGVHHRNMATFWRRSWIPQADTPEFASVTDNFELWLTQRLQSGTRYDDLVTEVLTLNHASGSSLKLRPTGFYDANLSRPENLAASATRAFLGINLDCAQCHDHPFARWTRSQFWETAAFFAPVMDNEHGQAQLPNVRVPDTELVYAPVLLTLAEVEWPKPLDDVALRQVLVDWMKRDEERLLAKNAVNRLWSHFYGEAIVEPMDDLSRDEFQTGDRAELLSELSEMFIASGYDLQILMEGMVGSNFYRLASPTVESATSLSTSSSMDLATAEVETVPAGLTPLSHEHAPVRGLTGEQLYDSLQTAAGLRPERSDVGGNAGPSPRREFAAAFYVERTHNAERSITQALMLMNGSLVDELTQLSGNPLLASVVSSPFMKNDEQIDTVFIAVLGRPPHEQERQFVKQSFANHPQATREQHLGNLFWVLVNSSEFNTNH